MPEIEGTRMYVVTRKLHALKPIFRSMRQQKGDLSLNVEQAKEFLATAQELLAHDRHDETLLLVEHYCRIVLMKDVKLEQSMLRQRAKMQWLKEGDQCSRIFFRKVATRRATKQIYQIKGLDDNMINEPEDIVAEFVRYFEALLGSFRQERELNLQHLRSRATHVLTKEEGDMLVTQVTRDEVKDAFFDIEEDKAPRPDGFPAGFYKAAWPIVGWEVTYAILEFFHHGRLLKQINSTIISLIPKELFSGYNQQRKPPWCALNVDLRKAYDMMEWDFLFAVLRLYKFPEIFIGWIRECVTTTTFTIALNGGIHGFFAGARRLRQGDPMSPYLLVLVMEILGPTIQQKIEVQGGFLYHWQCEETRLFQLSFADDLQLLCRADESSIRVFKEGLDDYSALSGLHTNAAKSQVIFSKAAQPLKHTIVSTLDFQEGELPVTYLGLSLIASRLSISDCKPLLIKIDKRLQCWASIQLSFAARIQLIKSVLMSLQIYWAMAFILPKGVIKEIEKWFRQFLWKGASTYGYSKVFWNQVCRPVEERGQGIMDIVSLNRTLISRHIWRIVSKSSGSIWVKWICIMRLQGKSIWTVEANSRAWGWRKLLGLQHILLPHIHYKIGNGELIYILQDPWHPMGILMAIFPHGPYHTHTWADMLLREVIHNGV
ncbi:uncharacterized protein LOC105179428 [Sesamum indicum]|uniref:Uncharacterized protein LOC105179428 n=1 Tax=Sesamum indicum TaxID=4182 RepID=A0A6I9V151_SESIN|nr:uncharacterized protein LOC105179428 [Sesamum indicum]